MPIGLVAYAANRGQVCLQNVDGFRQQSAALKKAVLACAAHGTPPSPASPIQGNKYSDADDSTTNCSPVTPSLQNEAMGLDQDAILAEGNAGATTPVQDRLQAGLHVDTVERGLVFDEMVAQENGTEGDGSLDTAFDPSLSLILTLRIEIVAVMFLRGWETRFKNFNWMLCFGVLAGSLYVLRTFIGGALCPFGDANDSSTWKFDYCTQS
jgi:hypothetical protein